MTSSDNDPRPAESSDSAPSGSEPPSAGHEAPPIESTSDAPEPSLDDTPAHGYAPPPAYHPPTYVPPTPATGFPPPGYGAPGYPPPPQYGEYSGGYPGAEYGYGAPAPQGNNGLAIGSLVASLIAIPLIFACFAGTVASIVAIVLGIIALNQIKTTGQSGKEMAIAGTAIGAFGLLISLILMVIVAAAGV
ncbi:DUF4190 domain-containing protein [Mycolicibacterium parafortuitum]|uniref:DUF4190 domain-containing protein n=1 Tax=Mycolicibacterium parafortuitum TaxID=39692 RepID=A0A375YQL7_MYCPF|nr:DUF4190 domain-containing protein [Mycolicibacterium parafortuitum]SRX83445.1 hypothetical protein MPP7335_05224 [Mycolicibacterium parafortuitum]